MEINMSLVIIDFIASIGTLGAFIVAINMFRVTKKSFIMDNERLKKQSTIEYYNEISESTCIPLRLAIIGALKESIANYSYKTILPSDQIWIENYDLKSKCFSYCRKMERFAVGIKLDIYDYETFYNIAGETTAQLFQQIEKLIEKDGYTSSYKTEFCNEYIILCRKLVAKLYLKNIDLKSD